MSVTEEEVHSQDYATGVAAAGAPEQRVTSELFIDAVLCPEKGRSLAAGKDLPEDISTVTVPPLEASIFVNRHQQQQAERRSAGAAIDQHGGPSPSTSRVEEEQREEEEELLDPRLQVRIIPQLLREVITHTQARQILHLRLFAETLPDFLQYCDDTTDEEWVMLLVLLFTFVNRRDGLTQLQKKNNEDISDACFLMLYQLLSEAHAQTIAVHVALKEVLERLELTEEMLHGKLSTLMLDDVPTPDGLGEVITTYLPDPQDVVTSSDDDDVEDEDAESASDLASSQASASSYQRRRSTIPTFTTSKPSVAVARGAAAGGEIPTPLGGLAPLPHDPYFFSIDSLPQENRGYFLTERDFLCVEHWYLNDVTQSSEGKLLVTLAIQKSPPAGRVFVASVLKAWTTEHPTGEASLTDVLQFMFPDCPQRTLLKRVAGQPLVEPPAAAPVAAKKAPAGARRKSSTKSVAPALLPTPVGSSMAVATTTTNNVLPFHPPAPVAAAYRVMTLHHLDKASVTKEYLTALHDWFVALDFRNLGKVDRRQVEPFIDESIFMHGKKVPNSFDFVALVQLVLGEEGGAKRGDLQATQNIRAIGSELEKTLKLQREKQLKVCKTDNEAFEQALLSAPQPSSSAVSPPRTPPTPPKGGTSPVTSPTTAKASRSLSATSTTSTSPMGTLPVQTSEHGRLITSLSGPQVTHLRFLNDRLLAAYLHRQTRVKKIARKEVKQNDAAKARQAGIDMQLRDQEDYMNLNVPLVYGPFLPQQTFIVAGMKVKPSTLQLDAFLSAESGWKPLAVRLLRNLDRAGIHPELLIHSKHKFPLHTLFQEHCVSDGNKVYRDFAFCSRRVPSKSHWEGNQALHVKTNIPTNSDIKYRIQLEGFNYGTNAPVSSVCVGYAARMLEHIDCMESYGWPDGWDAFSILHYGKGIDTIVQYVSSDGFVTLRCEAKSLQAVGFSVSAWLVIPDFGDGFAMGAKIYHQEADL